MRAFFTLAVLISLATAASAQRAPEPEPAWRASALALVPAGYVAGEAYRTDAAGVTGYLAVYPANSDDPKTPASVFAPRQTLVVALTPDATRALSAELKSRSDPTRGNRDTTMTDPDGEEERSRNGTPSSPPPAQRFPRVPSPAISAPGRRTRI